MRDFASLQGSPFLRDCISLRNGEVSCIIGVLPFERNNEQKLRFNIHMFLDTRTAAKSCDLYHSSDYSLVKTIVERLLTEGHFQLLETAAEAIAHILLHDTFAGQLGSPEFVQITLDKPEVFEDAAIPEVRIMRQEAQLQQDLAQDQIFKCQDLEIITDEETGYRINFL